MREPSPPIFPSTGVTAFEEGGSEARAAGSGSWRFDWRDARVLLGGIAGSLVLHAALGVAAAVADPPAPRIPELRSSFQVQPARVVVAWIEPPAPEEVAEVVPPPEPVVEVSPPEPERPEVARPRRPEPERQRAETTRPEPNPEPNPELNPNPEPAMAAAPLAIGASEDGAGPEMAVGAAHGMAGGTGGPEARGTSTTAREGTQVVAEAGPPAAGDGVDHRALRRAFRRDLDRCFHAVRGDLPAPLRRAGVEGTVEVEVRIAEDGRVEATALASGSGHERLDRHVLSRVAEVERCVAPPAALRAEDRKVRIPFRYERRA